MLAAIYGHGAIVTYLVEQGANKDLKNEVSIHLLRMIMMMMMMMMIMMMMSPQTMVTSLHYEPFQDLQADLELFHRIASEEKAHFVDHDHHIHGLYVKSILLR